MFKRIGFAVFMVLFVASYAYGAATLFPYPKFTAIDSNGDPLSGGKVYTYETGTTTNKTTWTDADKGTANANPVILDSNGQANIWLDGQYRIVLKDSADVTQWTVDNVDSILTTLAVVYPEWYGATGDGATDDTAAIQDMLDAAAGRIAFFSKPSVKYKITAPVNISSNTRVLGAGYSEIYQATEGASAFNIPDNRENIEIAYFKFTGTGSWNVAYAGRSAIDSNQTGGSSGVNDNLSIHDNWIESVSTSGISGTYRKSRIYSNTIIMDVGEHGIYIDGDDIWVSNNYIEGPGDASAITTGIKMNDAHNVHITRNIIDNFRHSNILAAAATPQYVFIEGNILKRTVAGASGDGIRLSFGSDFVIRDNYILSSDFYGIYSKLPRVTIVGNYIKDTTQGRAVEIDGDGNDISDTVIQENVLVANLAGGIRVYNPDSGLIVKDNLVSGTGAYIGIKVEAVSNTDGVVADNVSVGYNTPLSLSTYPESGNIGSWGYPSSPKVTLQGTGTLTNGTTNTDVTYIDQTPSGEWTGTDADIATSDETTVVKESTGSLKVTIAAGASAGDTVTNPLSGGNEDWTGNESVGMWIYSTVAFSAGDWDFRITDSVAGDTDTDIPAVAANTWVWVEVDISGVADASKDVITDIDLVYTVDGGAMDVYFDFLAKWDVDDETDLALNISYDGMLGVTAAPIAAASDMAWTAQTEYTDYFINYASTDNLVVITDESANCFIMQYAYQ